MSRSYRASRLAREWRPICQAEAGRGPDQLAGNKMFEQLLPALRCFHDKQLNSSLRSSIHWAYNSIRSEQKSHARHGQTLASLSYTGRNITLSIPRKLKFVHHDDPARIPYRLKAVSSFSSQTLQQANMPAEEPAPAHYHPSEIEKAVQGLPRIILKDDVRPVPRPPSRPNICREPLRRFENRCKWPSFHSSRMISTSGVTQSTGLPCRTLYDWSCNGQCLAA
jgi:hypothetical protein